MAETKRLTRVELERKVAVLEANLGYQASKISRLEGDLAYEREKIRLATLPYGSSPSGPDVASGLLGFFAWLFFAAALLFFIAGIADQSGKEAAIGGVLLAPAAVTAIGYFIRETM